MSALVEYLVWLPVMLACLGGIIGWAGSFGHGVRLLLFSYGATVIAVQHSQIVASIVALFIEIDTIPFIVIVVGVMLVAFIGWEIAFHVLWRPAPAHGGFWRRSGGLLCGLVAGWGLGAMLHLALNALNLTDNTVLYTQPAYALLLRETLNLVQMGISPLLP
jgi:hypothetical protein